MQVSCANCGAVYSFDASAIPAQGYNAQCTTCSHVFFVAPEAPAAPVAQPAPQPAPSAQPAPQPQPTPQPHPQPPVDAPITVACPTCQASYQFSPQAIPPGGYDAQCTQCSAVFFVGPPAQPVQPLSLDTPKAPSALSPPEDNPVAQELTEQPAPAAADLPQLHQAPFEPSPHHESSDLLAMAQSLGEPDAAPEGASMEDDFEQIMRAKRRRWLIIGAIALVIPLLLGLVYFALPSVWDASLGSVLGVKARIHPDAIPLYEAASTKMWEDRPESYREALQQLHQALQIDPLYSAALGLAAQAHVFIGKDLQEEGERIRSRAKTILAQITAIQESEPPPKDAEAQTASLEKELKALNQEASKLFQAGSQEFSEAGKLLTPALNDFADSPEFRTALGIYYLARDPNRTADGSLHLRAALKHSGLAEDAAPEDIRDPWLLFLQGMVKANQRHDQNRALPYLQAAVERQPAFQRARYQQLLVLEALEQPEEAQQLAQAILNRDPEHPKAKAHLHALSAASAPEATVAGAPNDHSAGHNKAKRLKKRNR